MAIRADEVRIIRKKGETTYEVFCKYSEAKKFLEWQHNSEFEDICLTFKVEEYNPEAETK